MNGDILSDDPLGPISMLDEASPLVALKRCPILITEELPPEAIKVFRRVFPEAAILPENQQTVSGILEAADGARAIILTVKYRLDEAFFQALPKSVEIIALYSSGFDHVDLAAARERRVTLINTPNILADSVADLAMALILGAARRVLEGVDLIRSGRWAGFSPTLLLGKEMRGRVLGIFGMGNIGREVSTRAQAFGMNVAYRNRTQLPRENEGGARYVADERAFLEGCDILLLAAPLTPETHKFLNAERIRWLPQGAIVVNISRGELIDDDAFLDALLNRHVAAAGLDVYTNEPAVDQRYLTTPGVLPLPHIGSATIEARIAMAETLVDDIERILLGERPSNAL
ncbi:D-glycerate dehydrogenase [Rhizobium sp. KVB221]|uniref:D-glycerate dehydrogenase n=1 Tax=Rhizobium setariae TaxID=2801340 RepID=A0A936YPJ7_9HYPH|nr:D-glycerate dehydrogenase [Rhizobium setariae]MBL0374338.1 D-glycerate dehydrogenase [Rhizobium setariae]